MTHRRRCPRCRVAKKIHMLASNPVRDLTLEACASCGGMFVDRAMFDKVVADRQQTTELGAALGADLGDAVRPSILGADRTTHYLQCPDCESLMHRHNFGRSSGVIVDVCKAHGVWFDADELRGVLSFVARGGLDQAKKRELEELEQRARDAKTKAIIASAVPNRRDHEPYVWSEWWLTFELADFVLSSLRSVFRR